MTRNSNQITRRSPPPGAWTAGHKTIVVQFKLVPTMLSHFIIIGVLLLPAPIILLGVQIVTKVIWHGMSYVSYLDIKVQSRCMSGGNDVWGRCTINLTHLVECETDRY